MICKESQKMLTNRNAVAWLLLVTSIGLHVFDEAIGGFLPYWNQFVFDMRDRFGFFPAPTFSFAIWFGGLIGAVIAGYCMTLLVARGGKVIRAVTLIFGILMVVNTVGHLLGSFYFGEMIPGILSSPLMLISATYVIIRGLKGNWQIKRKM